MTFRLFIFLLLASPVAAAVPSWAFSEPAMRQMVEQADRITFYSLDPTDPQALPPEKLGPETVHFHGYVVLGVLTADSAPALEQARHALIASLGAREEGPPPECFAPRIGISLAVAGKQQDVLLCFQCVRGVWYLPDGDVSMSLTPAAEAEFNALLDARGIARDIPEKITLDAPKSPPASSDPDETGSGGGVPEPEFWLLLFISWAVGSLPSVAGGVALGFGIHRKSNLLKIVGLLLLLLGLVILAPMTLLLAMWVIYWMTV